MKVTEHLIKAHEASEAQKPVQWSSREREIPEGLKGFKSCPKFYLKFRLNLPKVVSRLLKSRPKVVLHMSQSRLKVISQLSHSLSQPNLPLNCRKVKVVPKLSKAM